MEKMNLFGTTEKPKRKTHSDNFKKLAIELAKQIGISQAAEELGVSPSSISNWKKAFSPISISNWKKAFNTTPINSAPIQDSEGNLTFTLDGNTYTLNVNSEEERNSILAQVNSNSVYKWDWFKEVIGEKHWVLYNTEMYEVNHNYFHIKYLHYKEKSNLAPTIPINATSCYSMFRDCSSFTDLDLSNFNTSKIINMEYMFCKCSSLITLDLSNFDTSKVISMEYMFCGCSSLMILDLSNFDTSEVISMFGMFSKCSSFKTLDVTNFDTSKVTVMDWMFSECSKLTSLDLTNFDTSVPTS